VSLSIVHVPRSVVLHGTMPYSGHSYASLMQHNPPGLEMTHCLLFHIEKRLIELNASQPIRGQRERLNVNTPQAIREPLARFDFRMTKYMAQTEARLMLCFCTNCPLFCRDTCLQSPFINPSVFWSHFSSFGSMDVVVGVLISCCECRHEYREGRQRGDW
jgi:hypothetical protein